YRAYGPDAVERVRLVRRALAVGFTLDELARILKERATGRAPCKKVRALAAAKLTLVEERLAEMKTVRDELRATLKDWDQRLARAQAGVPARLLETLATDDGPRKPKAALTWTRKKRSRNDEADNNSSGNHAAGGRMRGDG
ncbi:MAG TPA: MerR family DNA-binding protein, partial [Pyrinomonadaceae bacterium]|nr:MerR family DNA-binding protein [Pyrinomonadaceae bacterium]